MFLRHCIMEQDDLPGAVILTEAEFLALQRQQEEDAKWRDGVKGRGGVKDELSKLRDTGGSFDLSLIGWAAKPLVARGGPGLMAILEEFRSECALNEAKDYDVCASLSEAVLLFTDSAAALPPLLEALDWEQDDVARAACKCLHRHHRVAAVDALVPRLVAQIGCDRRRLLRKRAAAFLHEVSTRGAGDPAFERLRGAVQFLRRALVDMQMSLTADPKADPNADPDYDARRSLIRALGNLKDKESALTIIQWIRDPRVQDVVIEALGNAGDPAVAASLCAALTHDALAASLQDNWRLRMVDVMRSMKRLGFELTWRRRNKSPSPEWRSAADDAPSLQQNRKRF